MSDVAVVSDDPPSCGNNRVQFRPRSRVFVHQTKWGWPTLWLMILAVSLMWRIQNIDAFGLMNDEGAHLMWAKLSVNGYPLYSDTRAAQSPLFLETVAFAFQTMGETVTAGRLASLAGFVLLAVSLGYLAYQSSGWLAATAALIMLSCSPLVFDLSRAVMAEMTATALAVTALAVLFPLSTTHQRLPRIGLLIASGMLFSLSLLTKALNPFVAGVALLLLVNFLRAHKTPFSITDPLWWLIGSLCPLIITGWMYPVEALYQNLILFRVQLRATEAANVTANLSQFQTFVVSHWGVCFLAVAAIHKWTRPNRFMFLWLMWLMAGLITLAWHKPLFSHHFIILLPPLILLAAETVKEAINEVQQWPTVQPRPINVIGCTLIAFLSLSSMVQANQQSTTIVTGGRETQAIEFLQDVSHPTDFVMGDSQLLIFMADRQTPPPLGDVALVGIKAGLQTSERLIKLTETYHAPAVVRWSLRLPWLPDYLAWVEANYLAKRVWDDDHIIHFVPRLPADYPLPNKQNVDLDGGIRLRGYKVDLSQIENDATLNLTVYWQTAQPLTENYTIFTQLLDAQGQLVTSWDSQPVRGHFPTTAWPIHELISDMIQLPLPDELPANDYTLITGMYQLDSLTRLRQPDGSDYITLTHLTLP